jgi:hypothetical protein
VSAPTPLRKTTGLRQVFRALNNRNYRLFFFGQGVSLIGTWMQTIAQGWLVYRITHSPFLLGMVGHHCFNSEARVGDLVERGAIYFTWRRQRLCRTVDSDWETSARP